MMPSANVPVDPKGGTTLDEKALLLQAWSCVLGEASAVYLSGPITTGPRFVEWVSSTRPPRDSHYAKLLQAFVVEPNTRELQATAAELRATLTDPILEPASLHVANWKQRNYLDLWSVAIERFIKRLIMMPGWQYSIGCAEELTQAFDKGIPVNTLDGLSLSLADAIELLSDAVAGSARDLLPGLEKSLFRLQELARQRRSVIITRSSPLRKDESLDRLAEVVNVAQFVSFSPGSKGLHQEFSRIAGTSPNHLFGSVREALSSLLERSSEASLNLRSYTPEDPQSREFLYGIRTLDEATQAAERLGSEGLFVIANETIDVHDGGVSGVALPDIVEFAPDDTPRGVEKPGTASLPREWAKQMLAIVYGFTPQIDLGDRLRLEFSIHPKPRGWRQSHTIGWELGEAPDTKLEAKLSWPNLFSKVIGDKVYGLLVAHLAGLPVPLTTVINRRVAPFSFGRPTGSFEKWLRTSPREQQPGKYTTTKGWSDPFALIEREDEDGDQIVSVLSQAAVPAVYAGAAIVTLDGQLLVEGRPGEGDLFMLGKERPELLPDHVLRSVESLNDKARATLGPVRFEWVFDGHSAWIVQIHRGATRSHGAIVVPGEASSWVSFDVRDGLPELRRLVTSLAPDSGILLLGDIGLTSHLADVVRRSGVPTRIRSA